MAKPKNKLSGGRTIFMNKVYLDDRFDYAYKVLLSESARNNELGDSSKSPFYLLKTSEFREDKLPPNPLSRDPIVGRLFANRPSNPNAPVGEMNDVNYYAYTTGELPIQVSNIENSKNPDEYEQATSPDMRLKTYKTKQFIAFMNYINELARIYKSDILKFINRNINRVYPIGVDIDFNSNPNPANYHNSYGNVDEPKPLKEGKQIMGVTKVPAERDFTGRIITPAYEYGGNEVEATKQDVENRNKEIQAYKDKIKAVNTAIYNTIRNQKIDDPSKPSLIIPSIFWFGGFDVTTLDVRTTLPESMYTELLALEKTFEAEVFNAKVPDILQSFKNSLKELKDEYTQESANIGIIKQLEAGLPTNIDSNIDAFEKEYERQLNANITLQVQDLYVKMTKETSTQREGFMASNYVPYKVRDIKEGSGRTAFQNWAIIFVQSEEYDDFVKRQNIQVTNENIYNDEEYAKKMNPTLDIKKLAESKTFYNADVFEAEDPDGLNIELIDKLRKQEEEFNKTVEDLNAPFAKEQEERRNSNIESLKKLKDRIASMSGDMFKKLDEGMAVNKQNRIERKKQETEKEIEESTKEDKDSALASLRNYQSCTSAKPPEESRPPERVFQDVNLQDIITQTGRQLTGGRKKKNSVANQVYLLNKRYVDSNGFESPMIRTNSARKKGGNTTTTTVKVDDDLAVQGMSYTQTDTNQLEQEIEDMNKAQEYLGYADMVIGFIPVVGDALSAVVGITGLIMAEETKKKEAELAAKKAENDRLLASFYEWKEDMTDQLITTLGNQEDPEIYKKMKEKAIQTFRTIEKDRAPNKREIAEFSKTLDAERDVFINARKAITDQLAQNGEEIVEVIADILENQDSQRTELIEEGSAERMKVIDEFTTQLKDYIKKFVEEQGKLDEEDKRADEQAERVADKIEENQEELEDDAEEIAQLKGYSGCKSNPKSAEQLKAEALQELKDEQDELEEAQAQGTVPMQGLGKRYKKYNKNSIANQVYLLNMKYIKSF